MINQNVTKQQGIPDSAIRDQGSFDARQHPFVSNLAHLKITIDQEIEALKRKRYAINEPHSNLDLLLKRYELKKSIIGSVTHWYGNLDWWKKILIGLFIGAIAAGLGFLCHAPIIIAVVASICYLIIAAICIEHHQVTHKQTELLCQDIFELEKSLHETVKLYNEFAEKLHQIYLSASELSAHFAADIQQLEQKLEILNAQLFEYQKILDHLSKSEKIIVAGSASLVRSVEQIDNELHAGCESLKKESHDLENRNIELIKLNSTLTIATERLSAPQFYQSYLHEYERMVDTAKNMTLIVNKIQSHPGYHSLTHHQGTFSRSSENPENEATLSENKSLSYVSESSDFIVSVDSLIDQSNDILSAHQTQQAVVQHIEEQLLLAAHPSNLSLQSIHPSIPCQTTHHGKYSNSRPSL